MYISLWSYDLRKVILYETLIAISRQQDGGSRSCSLMRERKIDSTRSKCYTWCGKKQKFANHCIIHFENDKSVSHRKCQSERLLLIALLMDNQMYFWYNCPNQARIPWSERDSWPLSELLPKRRESCDDLRTNLQAKKIIW